MKPSLLFIMVLWFSGCADSENIPANCINSENVAIQFTKPFSYAKTDTLSIDGVKFTHVGFLDSLELGNYLPNKDAVFLEIRGKQATENTNEISMGRALARQLQRLGDYTILNGPELLTTGKLRFARTDGKKIEICAPPQYSATLFQ